MSHPDEATALKAKAAQDEQAMKRKAYELGDATKARTEDAKRQVQVGLAFQSTRTLPNFVKVSTDSTLKSAEARARQAAADTQDKFDAYKSSAQASLDNAQHSAEAKYDSYKAAAGKSLNDARQSTEHLYNEARSTVTGKAEEKKDEAKAGWFSWLGWGKSKSADAEKEAKILKADAEHEAKVLKAEAERKAK